MENGVSCSGRSEGEGSCYEMLICNKSNSIDSWKQIKSYPSGMALVLEWPTKMENGISAQFGAILVRRVEMLITMHVDNKGLRDYMKDG